VTLLYADDRAYLVAEHDNRWALGAADAPLLTFNDADAYGCAWAVDEPDGWDFPTVDLPVDRRPNGHGGLAGAPTYEPRTLTVEGTVTAPTYTALRDAHRRLSDGLLGMLGRPCRWTALDEAPRRGLWVQPTGKPLWRYLDDRCADFSFVVVADDPIKTGDPAVYGPIRLFSTQYLGGYPVGGPAPWTTSGAESRSVVVVSVANPGDEDAHALYRITGPVPEPIIQLGDGQYVHLRVDLGGNDVLDVDTYTGTVLLNGQNRYDAWGPGSVFPLIPGTVRLPDGSRTAGGVDVRFRSYAGGSDPAATLAVVTAPSWR
jgi:hypothetical protein